LLGPRVGRQIDRVGGRQVEPMGKGVVAVSAGLSLAALVALMALPRTETTETIARAAE
jgi:hypothetical protein